MRLFSFFVKFAKQLKRQIYALMLAYQDRRTPWYARLFTMLVVAYALSPVDLIPDFIPILGYLDDLILLPLGVWIAIRLIPPEVMTECREQVQHRIINKQLSRVGLMMVLFIWVVVATVIMFRIVQ